MTLLKFINFLSIFYNFYLKHKSNFFKYINYIKILLFLVFFISTSFIFLDATTEINNFVVFSCDSLALYLNDECVKTFTYDKFQHYHYLSTKRFEAGLIFVISFLLLLDSTKNVLLKDLLTSLKFLKKSF